MQIQGVTSIAQVLCVAASLFGAMLPAHARAQTPSAAELAVSLRQGGYVLVMRHTSSPTALPEKSSAAPGNDKLERQLDAKGQETARAMGEAIKALRIPIAEVLSSPTYRARETVRFAAFGNPKTFDELGDGGQGMAVQSPAAAAAWLRAKAAEAPRAGANVLIVTHAPNIQGAFGQSADGIADGETMVFRPDGKGGFTLVARVKIENWPRVVSLTQ